jgi:carbamoyltransferase
VKTSNRHPNVLGLCSFTHDSSAALISGGRLTGMAEEERLSGVKHTREYPAAAVEWLLREAGLTAADIDTVAYNFAGHRYLAGLVGTPGHLLRSVTRSRAMPRAASLAVIHHRYRQRMSILRGLFPNARIQAVPHHAAHGLYAFAASGLGWRRGDEEGTVMALAATGDPARFRGLLVRAIPLTPSGFTLDPALFPLRVLRHGWPRISPAFATATCPPRASGDDVTRSTRISRQHCRSAPSRS